MADLQRIVDASLARQNATGAIMVSEIFKSVRQSCTQLTHVCIFCPSAAGDTGRHPE